MRYIGTEVKYGSFYGTPEKTILVSSAQCTGAEEKLSDCTLSTLSLEQGKAALQTTQVAGVKCYTPDACVPPITTGISCTDTQLRLTGNNAQSGEGNLEYCYKGTWSPFCSLGANEATVACRQLGFTDADCKKYFIKTYFMFLIQWYLYLLMEDMVQYLMLVSSRTLLVVLIESNLLSVSVV